MIRFCGGSVRGINHQQSGIPNQDNYRIVNHRMYACVAVCDGLGSRAYAHIGSKLLSWLLTVSAKKLMKQQNNFEAYINRNVQLWHFLTWLFGSKHFDTTCLFVFVNEKKIILAQLGDGLISVKKNDQLIVLPYHHTVYLNHTKSVYKSKVTEWVIQTLPLSADDKLEVFLTTDGLSNEIIQDQLGRFMEMLSNRVRPERQATQNPAIVDILNQAPNHYNHDDKTIVIGG